MSKNAQVILLLLGSQVCWAFCCLASMPLGWGADYVSTAFQWAAVGNAVLLMFSSSVFIVAAVLVAVGQRDPMQPHKLHPAFKVVMAGVGFLLALQVALTSAHRLSQPDESTFQAPTTQTVRMFHFHATLDDGSEVSGVYGFVIRHPQTNTPVFVTTSQQFSPTYGLDAALSNAQIRDHIVTAQVTAAPFDDVEDADVWTLGAPIAFESSAFLASDNGSEDPMSDVMFFEAPQLGEFAIPALELGHLQEAPRHQRLYFLRTEGEAWVGGRFETDLEDVWEATVAPDVEPVAGSAVLNFRHEVVGHVTRSDGGAIDVFPLPLAHEYLGVPRL